MELTRPLPCSEKPSFSKRGKCKTFLVIMSFIFMIIKIHFYINGVANSLALKQKLGVTRNGLLIVTTMERLTSFIKLKSQSPHLNNFFPVPYWFLEWPISYNIFT